MKKSELKQLIREEIQKVLQQNARIERMHQLYLEGRRRLDHINEMIKQRFGE